MSKANSENVAAAPDLSASSMYGTTFLILIQLTSRILTFASNQLVLRSLSPDIMGTAAQLDLYLVSILQFSRESTRLAIQRQPLRVTSPAAVDGMGSRHRQSTRKEVTETQSMALQAVVNISYLSLGIGTVLVAALGTSYLYFAPVEVSGKPFFQTSLGITGLASLLELCVEPFFVVVQQRMLYKRRAAVETTAAFIKGISICCMFTWASWANYDVGVLPFALSYLGYSLALICGYVLSMSGESRQNGFSFLLVPITPRYDVYHRGHKKTT